MSRKISKVIILLRNLKFIVSFGVFISVFNAHILSNWMYGSFVWEHDSNVKKVVMLQKRGMRICCGVSRCHCIPSLKILILLTDTSVNILEFLMYVKSNLTISLHQKTA